MTKPSKQGGILQSRGAYYTLLSGAIAIFISGVLWSSQNTTPVAAASQVCVAVPDLRLAQDTRLRMNGIQRSHLLHQPR